MTRITISDIQAMKKRGEKIAVLTAYDYPTAKLLDEAGIPVLLVGDSLGMVVLGYDSTLPVTMEEMIHHTKAVVRGSKRAHVVFDMPFMSYQAGMDEAVKNAGRAIKETGAQSIKLECGRPMADLVRRLVSIGIPVMGHLGLTPQSIHQFGGYKVQGKTEKAAAKLIEDALVLEGAGCYALVLECVPAPLAQAITERLSIPTIGIGAGSHCDGQVQVLHDLLGFYSDFIPKHARRYAFLADEIKGAVGRYILDVEKGNFPTQKESFSMPEQILSQSERFSVIASPERSRRAKQSQKDSFEIATAL